MRKSSVVALILGIAAFGLPLQAGAQSYSSSITYPNPSQQETQQARAVGCTDPWVTLAVQKVHGRIDAGYCSIHLYNNGQWNSYNTLVHAVAGARSDITKQGGALALGKLPDGKLAVALKINGQIVAAGGGNILGTNTSLIGQEGANLIGKGGAGLIKIPASFIGTGVGSLTIGAPGQRQLQSKGSIRLPSGALYY